MSYQRYLENKEYILRDCQRTARLQLSGREGCWGLRWHIGPFWFENYFGDEEPSSDSEPKRLIIWQPVSREQTPTGWHKTRLLNHIKTTGYALVEREAPYWQNWSAHAKRHRRKWMEQRDGWEAITPTLEEFIAAYKRAPMDPVLRLLYIDLLKQHKRAQGEHLHLVGMRRQGGDGTIEAGFAHVDIPEVRQSKHFISFIASSARDTSVGHGMMDNWFVHALEHQIDLLDFGVFWTKGDPRSWKGFSRFKSQFGVIFVRYPYPMWRIGGRRHLT